MTNIIILIFVVGYLCITIENFTKVNKSAIALFMGIICWAIYMMGHPEQPKMYSSHTWEMPAKPSFS